ncbi:MAG: CHAP domain-containing protein, partial [Pseudonocardiales bacterium]
SYAYQIYDKAAALGITRQGNSGISSIRPGDMIVHGPNASPYDEGAGHVAIIDSISGSTVNVVEQNGSSTGRAVYTLSNGSLSRPGMVNIRGVVHDPDNGPPPGSPRGSLDRADVGAHRFDVTRGGIVDGTYNVCAYAINTPGTPGQNTTLGCRSFTVS